MNNKNKLVFIGMPALDSVKTATMMSMISAQNFIECETILHVQVGCYVDNARDKIVSDAKENKATHLMFIDSDMEFSPKSIQKLIDYNLDIVGGLYPRRQSPYRPTINRVNSKKLIIPSSYPTDRLFEVDAIGTGFLLIDMKVFDKLGEPPYFKIQQFHGVPIRDDVYFCISARKKGFKVWADPTLGIGHVGEYTYTMKDHEAIKSQLVLGDVEDVWKGEL